jgi:4-amino-4-deoxy-L-arabinose transferase-like glycosyltransferase
LWLGHPFEGFLSAVRIPSILLSHLTFGIWLLIAKKEFPCINFRWFFILLLFNPLFGWGSLVVTPDLPLNLFWALSLYLYLKALKSGDLKWYSLLGLSLGFGFLSKYSIVLILPVFLIHLSVTKQWKEVNWLKLMVTVALGFTCCLPVLIWNYQNDWQSFLFQINHGFGGKAAEGSFSWNWPGEYVGTQFLLLAPWFWLLLYRGIRRWGASLTSVSALFPWAFFLYSSFKAHVEANWAITSFPAAYGLIVRAHPSKWLLKWTLVFWITTGSIIMSHWYHPWVPGAYGKLNETHDIREIIPELEGLEPLFTSTHQLASLLSFEMRTWIYKHVGMNRYDFFDSLAESKPQGDFYILMMPDHLEQLRYNVVEEIPLSVSRYKLFKVTQ